MLALRIAPSRRLFGALALAALAACGDDGTGPTPEVAVSVSPTTATVGAGGTQALTASVSNASDGSVTWTASGGTVQGSGASVTWTAPIAGGQYTVTVSSVEDPTKSAAATLTVTPVAVGITPATAALVRGEPTTFTAAISGTELAGGVTWTSTCGDLDADGLEAAYEAPLEAGTCDVTATSDVDAAASATVSVTVRRASSVTAEDDADDGACTWEHCSLREAIAVANADAEVDTIYLGAAAGSVAAAARGPARVIVPESSLPTITTSVAIIGEGSSVTEIDMQASAQALRRAFDLSGAEGGVSVWLEGITVRNAVATGGPALYVRDGAMLAGRDLALLDNTAVGGEGGAVVIVGEGSSVDLEDTVVEGNQTGDTGWPGGGVSVVSGGSLRMVGGRIAGNTSKAWGGGVRGFDFVSIELDGTTVEGNVVEAGGGGGGGLFLENPGGTVGTVVFDGVDLSNNTSHGDIGAGGMAVRQNLDVTITNSTVTSNEATGGAAPGGAITVIDAVTLSLAGSTVSGNSARLGGGLWAGTGTTIDIDDTSFDENEAGERGGGLFFWGDAVVDIVGGSVNANTAGVLGGAGLLAMNEVVLTVDGTEIADNLVTGDAAGGGVALFNEVVAMLENVQIRNNEAPAAGGLYLFAAPDGSLTLRNAVLDGNTASSYSGGGVFGEGPGMLTLENVAITNNTAALSGGGLSANTGHVVSVTGGEVRGNASGLAGGGLWVRGPTTIDRVTVAENSAGTNGGGIAGASGTVILGSTVYGNTAVNRGGGIFFVQSGEAAPRVVNSTLSGNTGEVGGGLQSLGGSELVHVTVAHNEATAAGGGIHIEELAAGQSIVLTNTLLAANAGPAGAQSCAVVSGAIASNGGNLADDGSCTTLTQGTDQTDIDALLAEELADNGGPTMTHALLAGSPAIDAGVDAGIDDDQRGEARDDSPDVGSVEAGGGG